MEPYRCGRCHVVLAEVAAPTGDPSALLLDPLVERRLLAAVARHQLECVSRIRGESADPE
jgi:hypothetical protein